MDAEPPAADRRETLDQLVSLLYRDLKSIARRERQRVSAGHTLATTALIHEAYLRLVDQSAPEWTSRSHFLGTDIWSTADPGSPQGAGWLGRYLDMLPSPVDPPKPWSINSKVVRPVAFFASARRCRCGPLAGDLAADHLTAAAFGSAGQRCMAISVAVAVGEAADLLVQKVRDQANNVTVGEGTDASSDMGPLITPGWPACASRKATGTTCVVRFTSVLYSVLRSSTSVPSGLMMRRAAVAVALEDDVALVVDVPGLRAVREADLAVQVPGNFEAPTHALLAEPSIGRVKLVLVPEAGPYLSHMDCRPRTLWPSHTGRAPAA